MSKDPAFLFYSDNFMTGTMFFTDEQVGKYIRLLCAQHLTGHLSENHMIFICKEYDKDIWAKFEQDEDGLYYNLRLEEEIIKRRNYTVSRSINKKGKKKIISKSYDSHMGNGNGNGKGKESDNKDTWRTNFEIYKSDLGVEFNSLLFDSAFITQQQKFYPGVDIKLSLEKAYTNFWGTEAGWKHKKKSKSNLIDWKSTLTNSISNNKVYSKPFGQPVKSSFMNKESDFN